MKKYLYSFAAALVAAASLPLLVSAQTGADWHQLSPATSPPARTFTQAQMAYDPASNQLILFGGASSTTTALTQTTNQTWAWNGTTWTQLHPAHNPPARVGGGLAYDASSQQLILFGGCGQGTTGCTSFGTQDLNDTWAWNGTDWQQLAPAHSPTARSGVELAWDGIGSKLVLFGGLHAGTYYNDTWTWNGTDWTHVTTATSATPSARWSGSAVWDAAAGHVVMFGGADCCGYKNDTWEWNGSNGWTHITTTTQPSVRQSSYVAYDAALREVVLFGGVSASSGTPTDYNDTWLFDGTAWTQLTTTHAPTKRDAGAMAFLPSSDQLIQFGGYDFAAGPPFTPNNETWELLGNVATTTSVTGSPNPVAPGTGVVYTAHVTATGGATPQAGTVAFTDNGTAIPGCAAQPVSGGVATCDRTYTAAEAGSRTIVATYSGDASFTGSTSAPFTENVQIPVPPTGAGPATGIGALLVIMGGAVAIAVRRRF